jgi:hypothetical protein
MSSTLRLRPVSSSASNASATKLKDHVTTNQKNGHPAPGTASSTAVDTARAELNAAYFMTAMMQPSADGINFLGAVFTGVTHAIKAVAKVPWSHWHF